MLATSNGFMAKNLGSRTKLDAKDSTKSLVLSLETEEDHHTPITKETADTRPTAEEDNISTTETEDASPPLKAETTWMSTL